MYSQNLRARGTIQKTVVSEINTSHKIIWDKIVQSAQNKMLFYAFDGRPGNVSIWALRGSRSPIAAIETKKVRLINRSLNKFYTSLVDEGILDHLIIFDEMENLVAQFSPRKDNLDPTVDLTGEFQLHDKKLYFGAVGDRIVLLIKFPIFSNGRSVGTVVYAKELESLAAVFEKDTLAKIYSTSPNFVIVPADRNIDQMLNAASEGLDGVLAVEQTVYAENRITYKIGSEPSVIEIRKDITKTIRDYNQIFVASLSAIAVIMATIAIIVYFILRAGFQPLTLAIQSLNKLAQGDTSIELKVIREDEVGKIAVAVQALRKTAVEYQAMRRSSAEARDLQKKKIYDASNKLAAILPENMRSEIRKEIEISKAKSEHFAKEKDGLFSNSDDQSLDLVEKLFSKLSLELTSQFNRQIKLTEAYQRFVPAELLYTLNATDIIEVGLGDQVQKDICILFADIRAFTTLAESLTPEDTFKVLNSYLDAVVPVIRANGGYVDKFIGDAIMALYLNGAKDAVTSAVQMLENLRKFNQSRADQGKRDLKIGIGLNIGPVVLGTLGVEDRLEGTVIGDAVNVAARLESLSKIYGTPLLISGDTKKALEGAEAHLLVSQTRRIDQVEVKGKSEAISIYEVFAWERSETQLLKIATEDHFQDALNAKVEGNIKAALNGFKYCVKINPHDGPAKYHIGTME